MPEGKLASNRVAAPPTPAGNGPAPHAPNPVAMPEIPDYRGVLEKCACLRSWYLQADQLTREQLIGVGKVLGQCHDGYQLVVRLLEARPDLRSCAGALEVARTNGQVVKCSDIRFKLGGEQWCSKCPEWHFCKTPLQLGLPHTATPDRKQLILRGDEHMRVCALEEGLKKAVEDGQQIYQRGRLMVRIAHVKGVPAIEVLDKTSLKAALQERFYVVEEDAEGNEQPLPGIPAALTQQLLVRHRWKVPALIGIVRCPILAEGGSLMTVEGYDPSTEVFLDLGGSGIPEVPAVPSDEDVAEAKRLIFEDFLADFKLKDSASLAHVVGLGVLPYVRGLIDGPVPLHLVSAHSPGCGKTWLVNLMAVIATGSESYSIAPANRDWDWRHRITSTLREGPTVICIDNVREKLDSAALASVLTCKVWRDRLNKTSINVTLPNTAIWCATANQPKLSKELSRRSVLIQFDPTLKKPWLRSGFKHPRIFEWVKGNRSQLLRAFLILCRNWFAKGRPGCNKAMGSYEEYVQVVGGILEANGIVGFLDNQRELQGTVDAEEAELSDFVSSWAATFGAEAVTNEQLVEHATSHDLMKALLSGGTITAKKNRMGRRLRDLENVVVAGQVICAHFNATNKTYTYRLAPEELGATENNPAEEPASPKPVIRRQR